MFQSLLYQFKLRFRMINPFDIKQEFKFLNTTQQQCTLHSKEQLNESTYLMRFAIPQQDKCLGTRIGQYISLNDPKFDINTTRYYCPISRIDDVGMFDLLVHAIYAENKNFSTHITTLNEGHILNINGPFTNYLYHGYGAIEVPKYNINSNYQYIGIVAESSAIAAFFQLIEGIATNGDNTHIGLLYVADTLEELVLMEELMWYMEEKKINATFMLRNEKDLINKFFSGPKGQLNPIYLEQYLPQPSDQTLVLVCGSRAFKKETKTLLENINHQNIAII
ncbi:unnamed protein product (macronuclear) [Paramecium tetraurelia]|uniref:FAD-binding FR-type domain-containing protein n=1 Tax=Paramecium tetraurelia TaxID=5888 RepID=A0C1G4_PARTE|nr:uncharacterized protein GSPATT00034107001 [Paramecium tetraurelia]CAK64631.1 unnamed protein product [Paramecium tetraurelia]|eukprot:XP_001432028.1 hypothetical protein (macronuclear) [Paramecium tetraurelia strain d4-2]